MKFWFPITVFFNVYITFLSFFFFFGLCIWILPSHCDMKKLWSLLSTWYSQSSEIFLCVWSMLTFIHQADRSGFRCSLPDSTMGCQENKAMGLSILQNLSGQLRLCSRGTKTFNLMEASLFGSDVRGEDTLRSEPGEGKGKSNQF